ncbi:MAG: GlmU family protein [Calditrichia bacterium]
MKIVLFEDENYANLLPLVYFRPVWELRCGATLLIDKMMSHLGKDSLGLIARSYLAEHYLDSDHIFSGNAAGEVLFLNGRVLMSGSAAEELANLNPARVLTKDNSVVAFRASGKALGDYFKDGLLLPDRVLNDYTGLETEIRLIWYPWDLIDLNGSEISREFSEENLIQRDARRSDDGVFILGKENVYISENARIMPGVVINAEDGPVWIEEGVKVMPNAVLEGPLYIGRNSLIKTGAKIYENTSIGPVCKVGGEVEESIFQEYSNKQHDGFLGHSYLGSWINIGADTNNSDLKNNYGEISAYLNGKPIETGRRFLGLIMGDHSKTAINTMFNTGTIVGTNCNVFGAGFPPKFIPSFSWGGSSGLREYNFDKAVEVAEVVMGRRNKEFTEKDLHLFKSVKELAYKTEKRERVR